jgi:tRNA(fMet)-specific endonuclease VapC
MVIRFTAPILLAAGLAGPALAQSAPLAPGPTALIHGNYCGPGNNAPLPPIDALDAACARHDACTPDGGLPSKACNLRLQREAAAISRDPRQPDDLRAMAGLVSVGASLMLADQRPQVRPAQPPVAVPAAVRSEPAWSGPDADPASEDDDAD